MKQQSDISSFLLTKARVRVNISMDSAYLMEQELRRIAKKQSDISNCLPIKATLSDSAIMVSV
jgi:hypothetical protein